jgi:predicted nucleotide-binding protein (sugar kinase/HSP70/actin superfamily)
MIYDRAGLISLLRLSRSVEAVSVEATKVREALTDPEDKTWEDRKLEDFVSGLDKVKEEIDSLIRRYPEEEVSDVLKNREDL